MRIFDRVIDIFEKNDLRILVQSLEPGQVVEWHNRLKIPKENQSASDLFNLDKYKDFSLLVLLIRVSSIIQKSRSAETVKARVYCDEGWKKSGIGIQLKAIDFNSVFESESILFVKSTQIVGIQMADCAAYILNRWQQLWGKESLKGFEMNFIRRVQRLTPYFAGEFGVVELQVDDKTLEVISSSYRDENSET